MMYSLEYELTADDFIDFQLYYNRTSKSVKASLLKSRLFLLFIYALGTVYFIYTFKGPTLYIALAIIVVLAAVQMLFMQKRQEMKVIRYVNKMIAHESAKKALGKKKLSLDSGLITYEEEDEQNKIEVSRIGKVEETELSYFLFKDEVSAIIVPKRAFQNIDEGNRFVSDILSLRKE